MKIIRVFPRRTSLTPRDDMAFVGDPPMMRPDADEVHVSTVFTWDKQKAERLAAAWAQYYPTRLGGPAFSSPVNGFTPGMYVRQGVTFTSRGCDNHCPWCLVPEREGRLFEIRDFADGNIIQDNNLLQCSQLHIERVFQMLRGQHAIQFTGGLDARLLTQEYADQIRGLRVYQVFLACDTAGALKHLRQAVVRLLLPRDKIRCYVLIGFDGETISQATARLEDVWNTGCLPFAQLYQPPDSWVDYPKEWRDLARTWSRPAAMKSFMRDKD